MLQVLIYKMDCSSTLFILFLVFSSAASLRHNTHFSTPIIEKACSVTQFHQICKTSLLRQLSPNPSASQIILASVSTYAARLPKIQTMAYDILKSSAGNMNRTIAAKNALEAIQNSMYRTELTIRALPRGRVDPQHVTDARAWLSASLNYLYGSLSGLSLVNDTQQVLDTVTFLNHTVWLASNALRMTTALDVHGTNVSKWGPPLTERQGFWEKLRSGAGFMHRGRILIVSPVDVTVCKIGCSHRAIQEAVDAAPKDNPCKFVIHIKEGVYKENVRVSLQHTNVVFLGDGIGKTVITGSLFVRPGVSTTNTPTLALLGDGFVMSNITVENTAGPDAHQAVAMRSDSDRSIITDCEFLGNQDTLYAATLRQYYKNCRILGNIDFIFGNSASVFHKCTILVKPRNLDFSKGETNAVTAQGRTDPAQSTGFVFNDCVVNGTDEYMKLYYENPSVHQTFLGRPWKMYSRTVFMNTYLGSLIRPEGWLSWSGDFALNTLYYGELENSGMGANLSGRVKWSSVIPADHAGAYSLQAFLQGDRWIPAGSFS